MSTGGFFTTGACAVWPVAADETRTSASVVHRAAMQRLNLRLLGRDHGAAGLPRSDHFQLHRADAGYRAFQVIAVRELRDACRRAGGDKGSRLQRRDAGKKANQIAQAIDHVRSVRPHHVFAVLLDIDVNVLRLADLVAGDDPGPQAAERVEALADVARVVAALAPGVADTDVPAHRVAVDVIERVVLGDVSRRKADDGA